MKRVLLYIGIALAAIGCTKDADVDTLSGANALTITSTIATRVANDLWQTNDQIGVYMTSADADLGNLGDNVVYTTSDGNGNFSSTAPLYYPSSGEVTIFAYYPWVNDVDLTAYPIDSEAQVDLLSVTKSGVASSSAALDLTFMHLLSKVSLTIAAGDGLTTADLAALEVKLSGISTTATFDMTMSKATTTNTDGELELTTAEVGTSSSAIVIPQELSGATLYFTTAAYGTFVAEIQTAAFETGNEYKYTATLNRDGVVLSEANIDPWNENTESSTADIVDIVYKNDTYYISTAAGLQAFADLVNGVVNTTAITYGDITFSTIPQAGIDGVLTRDIDLGGEEWTPIGEYEGKFDGGGNLVSGLSITSGENIGLFGYTKSDAKISNLGVSGSVSGDMLVGGVVGVNDGGTLINCYYTGSVSGDMLVGGVVGVNDGGTLINCYYTGSVSGVMGVVGGVVGENLFGTLTNCYNAGSVSGKNTIGGVVGWNIGGTLTNCYNSASVSGGDDSIGGVVGYNDGGTVTNCYWDKSVYSGNGVGFGVGDDSTTDMTTTEMQSAEFVTTLNNNAYDYNAENPTAPQACAWVAVDSDYPTLDFDGTPLYSYSISDITADDYPDDDIWYISDSEISDFTGLTAALGAAGNGVDGKDITVVFLNLETLPSWTFYQCTTLTSVSLPVATTIGIQAFRECSALTSISLPNATGIGRYTFCYCPFTSISLPNATEIGDNAFSQCTSLNSIELPVATTIWDDAFNGCTSLTSISLPSATYISSYVFSFGSSYITLDLGSSGSGITSIGSKAFYDTSISSCDLTIKIGSDADGVSVSGNALTYNSGSSTATFNSITLVTDND